MVAGKHKCMHCIVDETALFFRFIKIQQWVNSSALLGRSNEFITIEFFFRYRFHDFGTESATFYHHRWPLWRFGILSIESPHRHQPLFCH